MKKYKTDIEKNAIKTYHKTLNMNICGIFNTVVKFEENGTRKN